jgi:hypothetical protein
MRFNPLHRLVIEHSLTAGRAFVEAQVWDGVPLAVVGIGPVPPHPSDLVAPTRWAFRDLEHGNTS